jgi:hypothetical protein
MTGILPAMMSLAVIQASDRGINSNSTTAGFIVIALIAAMLAVMAFVFVRTGSKGSTRQ